jgi:fermentation-respiration switch protein FrsA (DUF1100 family)
MLVPGVPADRRPGKRRFTAFVVLVALLVGLLLWLGIAFYFERALVHAPRNPVGPPPSTHGFAYRDVSFQASGLTLRGWWIPGSNRITIVMLYGFLSSRKEAMDHAPFLHAAGYNLLLFDFRGQGASDGDHTTLGYREPDDVRAAINHARQLDPGASIALFGFSMGGSVAVESGARFSDVSAVIEDSGFAELSRFVASAYAQYTGLPGWLFEPPTAVIGEIDTGVRVADIRPIDDARRLRKPFLAIIGSEDQLVPPSEGRALFDAVPDSRKGLLLSRGAGHVGAYGQDPQSYEQKVLAFLSAYLRPKS